jgi:hypothetical protein
MTKCYTHVVDMAKENPPLFIPVKKGRADTLPAASVTT